MIRTVFVLPTLLLLSAILAPAQSTPGLIGHVDDRTYIAPGGVYRVRVPVLPELGGTISDTGNVVVFRDDYNVHVSIGSFPLDATQRWELSTRGLKDYLPAFFSSLVMPDFEKMFPGTHIESGVFLPNFLGGAVLCYTLLPGGSMFVPELGDIQPGGGPPVAKRGNLVFVQNHVVYVISIELAERSLEGALYNKTTEQENTILRGRLNEVVSTMEFAVPRE
jgi:hypothetical protein